VKNTPEFIYLYHGEIMTEPYFDDFKRTAHSSDFQFV
jgi:hypothetical protein